MNIMKKIQLTARFKLHAGKLEEEKKNAAECIALVKEKEEGRGALQYDWSINRKTNQARILCSPRYLSNG